MNFTHIGITNALSVNQSAKYSERHFCPVIQVFHQAWIIIIAGSPHLWWTLDVKIVSERRRTKLRNWLYEVEWIQSRESWCFFGGIDAGIRDIRPLASWRRTVTKIWLIHAAARKGSQIFDSVQIVILWFTLRWSLEFGQLGINLIIGIFSFWPEEIITLTREVCRVIPMLVYDRRGP